MAAATAPLVALDISEASAGISAVEQTCKAVCAMNPLDVFLTLLDDQVTLSEKKTWQVFLPEKVRYSTYAARKLYPTPTSGVSQSETFRSMFGGGVGYTIFAELKT